MGKMLNQQGHSNTIHQEKPPSPTPTTIYLSHPPPSNLLSQHLQKFNCYKRFVQNTIIQLGEDWRIQSGLLAQEIINERNLSNDEFCIFNEFMSGFVRAKFLQLQSEVSISCQQQQQQFEFLRYFCHSFLYSGTQVDIISEQIKMNIITNSTPSKQTDFSSNLTFKTLSLGFYITAGDVWMRMFKKYQKIEEVEEGIGKIGLGQQLEKDAVKIQDVKYFASLIGQQWIVQPQAQIAVLLLPYQQLLVDNRDSRNNIQQLRKSIKIGSVVVNITQTIINTHNSTTTVRQITLCRQFYLQLFLVWLVFSIKKSFNSTLFPATCFIRYCDIIIGSRIFVQKQKDLINYHPIYNQFKLLCDYQWKRLMKDYMVALNDDREVLRVLVKRIEGVVIERFEKQLQGKKKGMNKK